MFLDVGVNIGFWSFYFVCRFFEFRIFVIEVNFNIVKIFKKNVEINGYENIELIEVGVGLEFGNFDLFLNMMGN